MARVLERVRLGEAEYLVVCAPSGLLVALGGSTMAVDGCDTGGVYAVLRSCGIGTVLIVAAEQRIRARGLHRAERKIEERNPRAGARYDGIGYVGYSREPATWDMEAADGSLIRYERCARSCVRNCCNPDRWSEPIHTRRTVVIQVRTLHVR